MTGAVGAVVLALSMNSTLAAFTASITNSINTAAAGTLVMQEQNSTGTVTCLSTDGTGNDVATNSATCATINKYGGSTTLVPGTCTQSGAVTGSATDFCARLGVVITQTVGGTTTTITPASSTLSTLAAGGAHPDRPGRR